MSWQKLARDFGLDAPPAFWLATAAEIEATCNGVGPEHLPDFAARYLTRLGVPASQLDAIMAIGRKALDGILTDFLPVVAIHDWEFQHSDLTEDGFHAANARLLANCKRIIAKLYPWTCYFSPWRGLWKKRLAALAEAKAMHYACERYGRQAWRD